MLNHMNSTEVERSSARWDPSHFTPMMCREFIVKMF